MLQRELRVLYFTLCGGSLLSTPLRATCHPLHPNGGKIDLQALKGVYINKLITAMPHRRVIYKYLI